VTETEKANHLFLEKVRGIPGVVHVEPFGGKTIGGQALRAYVRDGDLDAEYAVYEAQREVYHHHPDARLRVDVLEESDIPGNPPGVSTTS
jgi:hypothetical protein